MDEKRVSDVLLSDCLVKKATIAQLDSSEPQDVMAEIVMALVKAGRVEEDQAKKVVKTLMTREQQGSTGIGGGCAIPHCSFEDADRLIMMIARSAKGVDFGCVTGEKVHVFVLVLYPPQMDRERRAVLGRVLHLCRNTNWLKFLKSARTAREINDLVSEYDNET